MPSPYARDSFSLRRGPVVVLRALIWGSGGRVVERAVKPVQFAARELRHGNLPPFCEPATSSSAARRSAGSAPPPSRARCRTCAGTVRSPQLPDESNYRNYLEWRPGGIHFEVTVMGVDLAKNMFHVHGVLSRIWWKFSNGVPRAWRVRPDKGAW